jgi:hypothetical protein
MEQIINHLYNLIGLNIVNWYGFWTIIALIPFWTAITMATIKKPWISAPRPGIQIIYWIVFTALSLITFQITSWPKYLAFSTILIGILSFFGTLFYLGYKDEEKQRLNTSSS